MTALDDIAVLLVARRRAAADKAEAEAQIAALDEQIKTKLGDDEEGTLGGVPVVTWKTTTSTRLDQKWFKEDQPDLYNAFLTTTESRRFVVLANQQAIDALDVAAMNAGPVGVPTGGDEWDDL